jgi:ATP phosphoribosyltransferase-like protein
VPKTCILLNAPKNELDAILKIVPSENPTVSNLASGDWVDIIAVMDKKEIRYVIPKLKEHGAKSIVEIPLSKIVE